MTQDEFNEYFITASQVSEEVGVTIAAVNSRVSKGTLPTPIRINGVSGSMLWVRNEIMPFLGVWKSYLELCPNKGRRAIKG